MSSKYIFHSLGANYTWQSVTAALLPGFVNNQLEKLVGSISSKWQAKQVILTYKGRDAIELALRGLGIGDDDVVLTQAFACCAIEEAIVRVGAKPIYVDISNENLNLTTNTLQAVWQKLSLSKKTKVALIVQHMLGQPAAMIQIANWCKKNNILLIEDLAQSAGAMLGDNHEVGEWGEAIVYSFGQDKIIDSVSGGAVVFKSQPVNLPELAYPPTTAVIRDVFYPLITKLITVGFGSGWGKVVFWLAKWLGWLRSPAGSPTNYASVFAAPLAKLANLSWRAQPQNLKHRRKLAAIYWQELQQAGLQSWCLSVTAKNINLAAWQRFPIVLPKDVDIIELNAYLKQRGYYLSDRWYRQPVDSGNLPFLSSYKLGSCVVVEDMANRVYNLPTHRGVSEEKAWQLVQLLSQFTKESIYV